jgi:hypothetical protein
MYRKFLTAVVAMLFVVGGVFADDIMGVFKKSADGKVTIEVDGSAKEYKVGEKAGKAIGKLKDGDKVKAMVEDGTVMKIGKVKE